MATAKRCSVRKAFSIWKKCEKLTKSLCLCFMKQGILLTWSTPFLNEFFGLAIRVPEDFSAQDEWSDKKVSTSTVQYFGWFKILYCTWTCQVLWLYNDASWSKATLHNIIAFYSDCNIFQSQFCTFGRHSAENIHWGRQAPTQDGQPYMRSLHRPPPSYLLTYSEL